MSCAKKRNCGRARWAKCSAPETRGLQRFGAWTALNLWLNHALKLTRTKRKRSSAADWRFLVHLRYRRSFFDTQRPQLPGLPQRLSDARANILRAHVLLELRVAHDFRRLLTTAAEQQRTP